MKVEPGRGVRGFTLLELIVVLLLTTIMAATAAPRFAGRLQMARLNGAINTIKAVSHAARSAAVTEGREVAVRFTRGGNGVELWVAGGGDSIPLLGRTNRRLPEGTWARFDPVGEGDSTKDNIFFRSDGSAGSGKLAVGGNHLPTRQFELFGPLAKFRELPTGL